MGQFYHWPTCRLSRGMLHSIHPSQWLELEIRGWAKLEADLTATWWLLMDRVRDNMDPLRAGVDILEHLSCEHWSCLAVDCPRGVDDLRDIENRGVDLWVLRNEVLRLPGVDISQSDRDQRQNPERECAEDDRALALWAPQQRSLAAREELREAAHPYLSIFFVAGVTTHLLSQPRLAARRVTPITKLRRGAHRWMATSCPRGAARTRSTRVIAAFHYRGSRWTPQGLRRCSPSRARARRGTRQLRRTCSWWLRSRGACWGSSALRRRAPQWRKRRVTQQDSKSNYEFRKSIFKHLERHLIQNTSCHIKVSLQYEQITPNNFECINIFPNYFLIRRSNLMHVIIHLNRDLKKL